MSRTNGTNSQLSEVANPVVDTNAPEWEDLPAALEKNGTIAKVNELFPRDGQYQAFTTTDAIIEPITFGVKSAGSDNTVLITANNGKGSARIGKSSEAKFTLSALSFQWREFFREIPVMPYQSYWGMMGMNIKQKGIQVLGDYSSFQYFTHVWRRSLELLHDAYTGKPMAEEQDDPLSDEDHITGRYITIEAPVWGKCKVFVEHSGTSGSQQILFLHTAGADSRQYHGVMNDSRTLGSLDMYAFDLPGHGRSFPSRNYFPGAHTNNEDAYITAIAQVIKKLGLNKPIVCGASMAGQICLAVAMRNKEVGAGGSIPLQGSDYLNMERTFGDKSPYVNQSLFNPEWIYGMMSPTSPHYQKALVWHLYSAQAYSIFHGDLDFYFGGWDGRSRMAGIDTSSAGCPLYSLCGEYDWSNTPEMSKASVDKVKGANFKAMKGLGHFPATENPKVFVGYLLEAVEWIQMRHAGKV